MFGIKIKKVENESVEVDEVDEVDEVKLIETTKKSKLLKKSKRKKDSPVTYNLKEEQMLLNKLRRRQLIRKCIVYLYLLLSLIGFLKFLTVNNKSQLADYEKEKYYIENIIKLYNGEYKNVDGFKNEIAKYSVDKDYLLFNEVKNISINKFIKREKVSSGIKYTYLVYNDETQYILYSVINKDSANNYYLTKNPTMSEDMNILNETKVKAIDDKKKVLLTSEQSESMKSKFKIFFDNYNSDFAELKKSSDYKIIKYSGDGTFESDNLKIDFCTGEKEKLTCSVKINYIMTTLTDEKTIEFILDEKYNIKKLGGN